MRRIAGSLVLFIALLFLDENAQAQTCTDLDGAYVYSQESTPVYLGFFGNQFATESINNQFGTYGSQFSAFSVRNSFGSYGSEFSAYSANNDFTSTPPAIYKWGDLIGYLTTNTFIFGGVPLAAIDANCTFFSNSPRKLPFIPVGLIASDGTFTDRIELDWFPSEGALEYGVYMSDSEAGQKVFLGTVVTSEAQVTQLQPEVTHYFWVSAINNFGESFLSAPDSGFVAGDVDGDGVANGIDNCPNDSNADQLDTDNDGEGNVCDSDDDNDGVLDPDDVFPLDPSESQDSDNDGIGDNADPDDDNDGTPDVDDAFPLDPAEDTDTDGDGIGNNVDPDDDNDGIDDTADDLPLDPTESVDTDGDGTGNNADSDDDGDGMPDTFEIENGFDPLDASDANGDADGDGYTNLDEYRRRTDPNDPNSSPSRDLSWLYFLLLEGNIAPVADAGADQNVTAGTVVILDGSGSSDADGDALSYSWTFVSTPSGSSALFDNADVINPKFTADLPGTYVIGLVVSDGTVESSRDTVRIQITQPTVTLYRKSSSFLNPTFDKVSLPYSSSSSTIANVTGIPTPTTYTLDTFKLTAEGQTFTIINVSATEVTGQVIPYFDSLSNDFFLADGEELNFELVSPLTGGVQVQLQFSFEILESGETFFAVYMFTSN